MDKKEAESLLFQFEDILRSRPPRETIRHEAPENIDWLGRACAAMELMNPIKAIQLEGYVRDISDSSASVAGRGVIHTLRMLTQARYYLKMQLDPVANLMIDTGNVFQYFDEIRRMIDVATLEVFFIDPYLDADFVSQYLPFVKSGVSVKLLTTHKLNTLLPSVTAFSNQNNLSIEVRESSTLHDRFLIVDRQNCYQSGASFKDGAKKSPTTIVEIRDAFSALMQTYEGIWSGSELRLRLREGKVC